EQIKLVKKMGSVNDLLEKFPLFGELPEGITFDDKELVRVEAMIGSMTRTERKNPQIIGDDRIERSAKGSGQGKQHVRGLRQRLMGFNQQPPRQMSDQERKKLRDKRKQERKNKKKNRRR